MDWKMGEKMRILLLIFLTFMQFESSAQIVTAFNDSTSKWFVAETSQFQVPGFSSTKTLEYSISVDTLIAGEQWHGIQEWDTYAGNSVLKGYVRQTGTLGLFLPAGGQVDTIYNYEFLLGDTIELPTVLVTHTVVHIDSLLVLNTMHKRIWFDTIWVNPEAYSTDVWIEGIGSVHGPLAPVNPIALQTDHFGFIDSTRMTCFELTGSVVYNNVNYTQCAHSILTGVNEPVEKADDSPIMLYPNPGDDRLIIMLLDNYSVSRISILDLTGRELIDRHFPINSKVMLLDGLEGIPLGVHIVRVTSSNGKSRIVKWVKQ